MHIFKLQCHVFSSSVRAWHGHRLVPLLLIASRFSSHQVVNSIISHSARDRALTTSFHDVLAVNSRPRTNVRVTTRKSLVLWRQGNALVQLLMTLYGVGIALDICDVRVCKLITNSYLSLFTEKFILELSFNHARCVILLCGPRICDNQFSFHWSQVDNLRSESSHFSRCLLSGRVNVIFQVHFVGLHGYLFLVKVLLRWLVSGVERAIVTNISIFKSCVILVTVFSINSIKFVQ